MNIHTKDRRPRSSSKPPKGFQVKWRLKCWCPIYTTVELPSKTARPGGHSSPSLST